MTLTNPFLKNRSFTTTKTAKRSISEKQRKAAMLYNIKKKYGKFLSQMFSADEEWRKNYLILDTETTGVGTTDRIIELSIISLEGEVVFSSLFNPENLPLADKITEITGIKTDDLVNAPLFKDKADELTDLLSSKTIIAWNSDFDERMMRHEFSLCGVAEPLCEYKCAMKMYHALRLDNRGRYPKLADSLKAEGIEKIQSHRAAGDSLDTLSVLKSLYSRLSAEAAV